MIKDINLSQLLALIAVSGSVKNIERYFRDEISPIGAEMRGEK